VWRYLADGDKAAVPAGLVREPIELTPQDSPIIYRNFIEAAGTRAIGVGYPEGANLAWDANGQRLALIWHGAFIDASRHWNGRGQGFEAPLGDDVIALPEGPPFARLASANDPWPYGAARGLGFRFRGYQLDDRQQPTFRYACEGVNFADYVVPIENAAAAARPGLRRTLSLSGEGSGGTWHFLAAAGKVDSVEPGVFRIDGVWTLKVESRHAPMIRDSGGRQELLVPVSLQNGPQRLVLEYLW
jgi:hypothetical protein